MIIENLDFITILSIVLITELLFLFSFRFTKLPFTGVAINNWYTKFGWTSIILDVLILIIGFYLGKFVYKYLQKKKFYRKKNISNTKSLIYFLIILLIIQIIHDLLFYYIFILNSKKNNNEIMDEFKIYAKKQGSGAIIGDSAMVILSVIVLFFIKDVNNDYKIFLNVLSIYLIGYFLYQKPLK